MSLEQLQRPSDKRLGCLDLGTLEAILSLRLGAIDPTPDDYHRLMLWAVEIAQGSRLTPEQFRLLLEPNLEKVSGEAAKAGLPRWRMDLFEDCRQHVALWLLLDVTLRNLAEKYDLRRYGSHPDRVKSFVVWEAMGEARHYFRAELRRVRLLRCTRSEIIARLLADVADDDRVGGLRSTQEDEAQRSALVVKAELALNRLPRDQRKAFELVVLEGLTQVAVAAVLGRDRKTVASWVAKARQALKWQLSFDAHSHHQFP